MHTIMHFKTLLGTQGWYMSMLTSLMCLIERFQRELSSLELKSVIFYTTNVIVVIGDLAVPKDKLEIEFE